VSSRHDAQLDFQALIQRNFFQGFSGRAPTYWRIRREIPAILGQINFAGREKETLEFAFAAN
jgi:hypothetical protein